MITLKFQFSWISILTVFTLLFLCFALIFLMSVTIWLYNNCLRSLSLHLNNAKNSSRRLKWKTRELITGQLKISKSELHVQAAPVGDIPSGCTACTGRPRRGLLGSSPTPQPFILNRKEKNYRRKKRWQDKQPLRHPHSSLKVWIHHWLDRGRRKKGNLLFPSLIPIDLHVASWHNQNLSSGT